MIATTVRRFVPMLLLAGCAPPADRLQDLAERSLSQLDGEIRVDGLGDEVEVLRDRWGIPHIYAESLDDLFLAQGFVTAQDRLWQMEVWRRWSEGRMAELIGAEGFADDRLVDIAQYPGLFDEMFELPYSREAVERATEHRLVLRPREH